MSEMVERVAQVIAGTYVMEFNDEVPPLPHHIAIELAKAAIDAMSEPTAAMCDAPKFTPTFGPYEAEGVWRAMCNAALNETADA